MNVLSLFDGMSCGQIALNRVKVPYENYYASEIDKYAIKITQKNYPNTIQLGDVRNWKAWKLPKIDLILAGSPCQGFSVVGNHLNFDDPRSKLLFEFNNIREELNPLHWLLENVKMKTEWRDVITNIVGEEPIEINSSLVSAQNRKRLYWTNIPNVIQPDDRKIYLYSILQDYGYGAIINRGRMELRTDKAMCLDANYWKGADNHGQRTVIGLERVGDAIDIKGHDYNRRVYSINGKAPSLAAKSGGNLEPKIALDSTHYRKLTPVECERLQTVPDNYTEGVSDTQRYKMLGNGWTVDVIVHILKGMQYGKKEM